MGKYKIEVTRTTTRVKTFEVEAMSESEAIDRAEQLACNFDFNQVTGASEYESHVEESPEDRGECPECGGKLEDASEEIQKLHDPLHIKTCKNCGNDYKF